MQRKLPCGLHVHMLRLLKLAEAKDPFKRVLSQTHINVHLCRSYRITFSYRWLNVHLAPVLLDVIGSLSESGIQGNIGKVLRNILENKDIKEFVQVTYIHPGVLGLTDKVKINEWFEDTCVREAGKREFCQGIVD